MLTPKQLNFGGEKSARHDVLSLYSDLHLQIGIKHRSAQLFFTKLAPLTSTEMSISSGIWQNILI